MIRLSEILVSFHSVCIFQQEIKKPYYFYAIFRQRRACPFCYDNLPEIITYIPKRCKFTFCSIRITHLFHYLDIHFFFLPFGYKIDFRTPELSN